MKRIRSKILPIILCLMCALSACFVGAGCNSYERVGKLLTIQEAYELNFLNEEDLEDLSKYRSYSDRIPRVHLPALKEAAAYEISHREEDRIAGTKAEDVIVFCRWDYDINGCYPVTFRHIDYERSNKEHKFTVSGVEFDYMGEELYLWCMTDKTSDPVYMMQEAYARGIVTKEEIQKIADMHSAGDWEELYRQHTDSEKYDKELNDKKKKKIKEAYLDLCNEFSCDDVTYGDICVLSYYGEYKGYGAAVVVDEKTRYRILGLPSWRSIIKAGVEFNYYGALYIFFYKL